MSSTGSDPAPGGARWAKLRFVAANRLVRQAVGNRPVYGRPIREAVPELAGQEALEVFERVFVTGIPEAMREWRILVDVGGRTVERFDTVTLVPLRDSTGEVRWLANHVEDVTEQVRARRLAEAQAAASEQRPAAARVPAPISRRWRRPAERARKPTRSGGGRAIPAASPVSCAV